MDCTYKTNQYKLPPTVVVGHTSISTGFYVTFAFLSSEIDNSFAWVLRALKEYKMQVNLPMPEFIVTDRDLALISVLKDGFPTTISLLCLTHMNKNVLAKCKPIF